MLQLNPQLPLQKQLDAHFGKLIVLLLYAEWNKESLHFRESLKISIPLFGQFDNVVYLSAAAESHQQAFRTFGVEYVPTVLFIDPFKTILRKFQKEDAALVLDSLVQESQNYRVGFEKEKKLWQPRVQTLIKESPVTFFMHGSVQNHNHSNDSAKLLQLLEKYKVDFTSHNVANDVKTRQWLRHFSGLQTFPQLFVNGELLGDIVTCAELDSRGEFLSKIPKASLPVSPQDKLQEQLSSHRNLIFIDRFSSEQATSFKQTGQVSIFNLAIDPKLYEFVTAKYDRKFPLVFRDGQLQE